MKPRKKSTGTGIPFLPLNGTAPSLPPNPPLSSCKGTFDEQSAWKRDPLRYLEDLFPPPTLEWVGSDVLRRRRPPLSSLSSPRGPSAPVYLSLLFR